MCVYVCVCVTEREMWREGEGEGGSLSFLCTCFYLTVCSIPYVLPFLVLHIKLICHMPEVYQATHPHTMYPSRSEEVKNIYGMTL